MEFIKKIDNDIFLAFHYIPSSLKIFIFWILKKEKMIKALSSLSLKQIYLYLWHQQKNIIYKIISPAKQKKTFSIYSFPLMLFSFHLSFFSRLCSRVHQVGFSIDYTRPCRVGYWILLTKSDPGTCRVDPKNLIGTQVVCAYTYTFFIRLYWLEEMLSKIYQSVSKRVNINVTAKVIINVNPVSNFTRFMRFQRSFQSDLQCQNCKQMPDRYLADTYICIYLNLLESGWNFTQPDSILFWQFRVPAGLTRPERAA